LSAVVIASATIPAAADAQKDKPVVMDKLVVAETKTHTLFMGTDIAVNLGKDLFPVRGVIGSSWIIDVNGEEKVVSARQAPLNLKITPSLKLTDVLATVAGYKNQRAYSFANDPSVRLTRGLDEVASMNADLLATASNAQHIADTEANKALGIMGTLAESDNQFGASALQATAVALGASHYSNPTPPGGWTEATAILFGQQYAATVASAQAGAVAFAQQTSAANLSQAENGEEPGGRLARTGLDAMEVEFEISSAKPLQKPYLVTMTRFHSKGTKPGAVQNLVYAKELRPISAHPTSVQFVEGGFPFDFELVEFQLHVYDHGVEVATTVSSKRVELTRDEAFEYVKIEYIGAHKRDTLPAAPVMGILPADLPRRLTEGKFGETFFVRVSKDGFAGELFADAMCSKKIEDSYLETLVRSIRFNPALDQGKPIEGVASLNLRQLKI